MTTATANKVDKILLAIGKIQEEVGSIPKNGVGPAAKGSFPFIKNDDILDKIHGLLVRNKVIVKPFLSIEHRLDTTGSRMVTSAIVTLTNTYISLEDGSEFTVTTVGEGSDIGSDTATRKAVTQAQKIANLLTFSIATGEEEEEGVAKDLPAKATATPASRTDATLGKAAAAGGVGLDGLRAQVKAAAGGKGLTSAEINTMGLSIDNDFFANADALTKLLAKISSLPAKE